MIKDSFALLQGLNNLDLLKNSPPLWWPKHGSFECLTSVILTQNTKFTNVLKALDNLKDFKNLDSLASLDLDELKEFIRPCGFYNQKAIRLKNISLNIKKDFKGFEDFKQNVSRSWLLKEKGIGFESADSILNYVCLREFMVVDTYTYRLLLALDYDLENYEDIQNFLVEGILANEDEAKKLLKVSQVYEVYALFHGMIVEYCKLYSKNKKVEIVL